MWSDFGEYVFALNEDLTDLGEVVLESRREEFLEVLFERHLALDWSECRHQFWDATFVQSQFLLRFYAIDFQK